MSANQKLQRKKKTAGFMGIDRVASVTPRQQQNKVMSTIKEREYFSPHSTSRNDRSQEQFTNDIQMINSQNKQWNENYKVIDLFQQQNILDSDQQAQGSGGKQSAASSPIQSLPKVNRNMIPESGLRRQNSNLSQFESYKYTTQSNVNKSMLDANIKNKMSISDNMIFESQQLQKANWLIMNQPDRIVHDYSQSILKDKQSVSRTEDHNHQCSSKKGSVDQVKDDNGLDLSCLSDKSNSMDTIWCGIRKWREKNVQYAKMEVKPYEITKEDLQSDLWGDSLSKGIKFEHRFIDNDNESLSIEESKINIQVHYEEVFDTGEKFLRIATRQWTDGFDPKSLNPLKECTQYEIQTLRCYRYCQSTKDEFLVDEFDLQHQSIYDVSEGRLNMDEGAFNNDFFTAYRNHTYFFQRVDDGFQLVRQSMTKPQSLPGPTITMESEITSNVHYFGNFFIEIENPENYQINFIKPASQNYSLSKEQANSELQFLLSQYVIVKEKRFLTKKNLEAGRLRIYTLSDPETPVFDETKKMDFTKVQVAFWMSKLAACSKHRSQNNDAVIIMRCTDREHQILIHEDPELTHSIKTLKREAYVYNRSLTHQIKIVHKKINLDDGNDPFDQIYAVSIIDSNYMPFPIYPLYQEQEKGKIGYNACQRAQNIFRENHAGSREGQIIFDEHNYFQNITDGHKNNVFYELKFKENQNYHRLDQYIATNTTILKVNTYQGIFHCWLTFKDHTFANFYDKFKELEQMPLGQNFKKRLYGQFRRSNDQTYQNNFYWSTSSSSNKEYSPNMSLQPMYIHQSKQNVMSYHNKLFVNEYCFEFHQKFLLIDLNQNGGKFIKIQLFDDETKDCRLIKYHSDPKSQKVILFFLQRNLMCKSDRNRLVNAQTGVYFFTVTTFSRLIQLSNNHNLQSYLLSKETTIQVMQKINKFIKMKYDRETLSKYQGKGKIEEQTYNHIAFEMVHDMLNPVKNWVPFIFSDLDSEYIDSYYSKDQEDSKYSTYLCFLNLEKYKLLYEEQNDKEDQNDQNEFIQKYYLQQFVNAQDLSKDIKTLHRYNQSNAKVSLSMFTRCSNWQENLFQPNSGSYSARYQIGLSNRKDDVQVIESQELIVTIQDDAMKIDPIALRHILPSRELSTYCQFNKEKIHLHRFIPEIDDHGNIDGSSMMVCIQVYNTYKQINPAIKNSLHDENMNENKSISEVTLNYDKTLLCLQFETGLKYFEFIEQRFAARAQVIGESQQSVEVQFEDNLRKQILKSDIMELKDGKYVFDAHKYEYGIIPFYGDQEIILQTPLLQMGYRKYVPVNRTKEFFLVHTSRMNSSLMQQQMFSKIELLFELYKSQKINITMSLPNFEEIMTLSVPQRQKVYFQHRYIFNGRNYCGIDLPHYKSDIEILKYALSEFSLSRSLHEVIPNSSFKFLSGYKNHADEECDQRVETLFGMFDCSRVHGFQLNLNNESFLQKSLDNNYARALYFLLAFILEKKNDISFQDVMMAELPQLICQEKVPILEFLSPLDQQDQNKGPNSAPKNMKAKESPCNIETRLISQELPFLGQDEEISYEFKSFENIFDIQKEIEIEVIKNDKMRQESIQNELTEQELIEIEENLCEIQYDYINFQPLIRKIKIDKMLGRKGNKSKGTEYLEKFDDDPKLINSISDLFLADMLQQRQEAPEFYLQKSVQKLIDRQYIVTKEVIFNLLCTYFIGFIVPFAINIYYQGNFWIQIFLTACGFSTQIFFLVIEYPEYLYRGSEDYLRDPWNYVDSTQIIFYMCRVIMNMWVTKSHDFIKLVRNLSTIICLLQSMLKLLQLIKYKEEYCFLVQMITQVFKDLSAFMTIFMLNVYIFAMVYFVMGIEFESEEYKDMYTTFSGFIQVFRNSIGDILPVDLKSWSIKNTNDELLTSVATGIVWIFWFINIFTMTIVFLNFVIAEVGNTYNEVREQGTLFLYQKKAEMNFFAQNINFFFGKQTRFVALVFTTPKGMSQIQHNNQLQTFSTKLKYDIQQILFSHQQEALRNQMKYDQSLKDLDHKMDRIAKLYASMIGTV